MPWSDAPAITVVLVAPVVVPLAQMLGNAAGAQHGLVAGFGLAVACNFLHSVLVHADPVHMPPGSADMALWPGSWARVAEALTLGLAATRLSAPGPGLAGLAAAGDGTRVPEDLPQVRRSAIMSVRRLVPWQCEYRVRMPDGSVRWHMTNAIPHREADGSVVSHGFTMDITDRKRAEQEIERLAFFDALTGLPNRRLLLDRLEQALAMSARHQLCGAVMMLDLDNFKTINETQGPDMGDRLLREVARRADVGREVGEIARQGGARGNRLAMVQALATAAGPAGVSASTMAFSTIGTPTLATLAATMKPRASATRPRKCHR